MMDKGMDENDIFASAWRKKVRVRGREKGKEK